MSEFLGGFFLTAFLVFFGWMLVIHTPRQPAHPRLWIVECKPIRGEVQSILADSVTMQNGVTRYFEVSDSSWVQTTSPCQMEEVGR